MLIGYRHTRTLSVGMDWTNAYHLYLTHETSCFSLQQHRYNYNNIMYVT